MMRGRGTGGERVVLEGWGGRAVFVGGFEGGDDGLGVLGGAGGRGVGGGGVEAVLLGAGVGEDVGSVVCEGERV